jgi:hypothetical protein
MNALESIGLEKLKNILYEIQDKCRDEKRQWSSVSGEIMREATKAIKIVDAIEQNPTK